MHESHCLSYGIDEQKAMTPLPFVYSMLLAGTSKGLLENRAVNLEDLPERKDFFFLVFWKCYLYHDLLFLCMN